MARIDREELRSLVRHALKEALGAGAGTAAPPLAGGGLVADMRAALARGKPATVNVAIASKADLDRFARAIAEAADHADLKAAITAGDLRFDMAAPKPAAARPAEKPASRSGTFQMNSGVLSETRLVEIARGHSRILVGSDVVMTPLARDKARELKVELVRQKP